MIKTLIYNLPPLDRDRPPISGAILAAICRKEGHHVESVDLQQRLDQFLSDNNYDLDYFAAVFFEQTTGFDHDQKNLIEKFIEYELQRFQHQKFDYILISFFSYLAQFFANKFLPKLRVVTDASIVIGGTGIWETTYGHPQESYAEGLKKKKIINEYIFGTAEESLPMFFAQGKGPGIGNSNFKQIEDLDSQVWPDYSYYDISKYQKSELLICGSRGCVRKCTFCDIAKFSPKYRYRSGKSIAGEIINNYEKFGITTFYFTDSLVNGSFKAFNDMCEELAKYKFENPISWSGQFIIRSKSTTPKDHFEMLKKSGCSLLYIGIESGSDRVRSDIGKKFTNDDIDFYLENFYQNNIGVLFLMFTGYITESESDHNETLSMFPRWQKYVATNTIQGLETLNILSILPDTPLSDLAEKENFLFLVDKNKRPFMRSWVNPNNPSFDFKMRVKRHVEMIEKAIEYKWPLWNGDLSMQLYEQSLRSFMSTPHQYRSYLEIKSAST